MTSPPPNPAAGVLIVEGSARVRSRLQQQLGTRHSITFSQSAGAARARAEYAPPLAAVVNAEEGRSAELELIQWLARRRVPVLAVIADDNQRRKLLGAGASLALVKPEDESEQELVKRHEGRIAAWLDAVARVGQPRSDSAPPLHTVAPTVMPARHTSAPQRSLFPHRSLSPTRHSQLAHSRAPTQRPSQRALHTLRVPAARPVHFEASGVVVCIGISTGGPEALEQMFRELPASMPPIVIVQHMPAGFTAALARRLDNVSEMTVREASHDEALSPGVALIAPGGVHMRLRRHGFQPVTELFDAPPVDRHRPSVNVLFESAADVVGAYGIGVIMTGMGDDGTRGALAMKARGALIVAQDADGCIVFGMPQRVIASGAVDHIVTLDAMAARLIDWTRARDGMRQ
ncbi:MAG: chemotaxis protein CheB [Polyangiaceae bacterium]